METILRNLEAVLCDPDGRCCINGTDADRSVVDKALAALRAADYLRRCADAQPVAHHAMLDSHRRLVEQAIQHTEHPSGMSTHDGKARIDASILRRMLAIIDSLPAVPHPSADASRDAYEGCREDLLDWKRRALKAEREARNLAKALADTVNGPTFMGEPAVPQAEPIDPHMIVADDRFPDVPAEPKREPLTDERIASVCLSYRHDFGLLSGDEQAGLMLEARAWERAFRKEWQR